MNATNRILGLAAVASGALVAGSGSQFAASHTKSHGTLKEVDSSHQ